MISVIIPTYNEAENISLTIEKINAAKNHAIEIIVADGGSTDGTICCAEKSKAITVRCNQKGRSAQMNEGAAIANGQILYFLHADSIPPKKFTEHILEAHGMKRERSWIKVSRWSPSRPLAQPSSLTR